MTGKPRCARPPRRQAGFTLLEALVALTLVASTGLALMAWINTSLQAVSRLQERDAEAQLKLAAVQLIQTVNPSLRPEGELRIGTVELRWRSKPAGPATVSAGFGGAGVGQYTMQLFEADVLARDADTAVEVTFRATLLGYRNTRGGSSGRM